MNDDFFIDGVWKITFYSDDRQNLVVKINEPGTEKFIVVPIELFFHLITDRKLKNYAYEKYENL